MTALVAMVELENPVFEVCCISWQAKTTKKIVLRMECTVCRKRKQIPLKRCKHFELGGDKKRKVCCLVWSVAQGGLLSCAVCGYVDDLLCLFPCRDK